MQLMRKRHFKTLFSARDRLHGLQGRFQYVRCDDCGLVYMNPQVIPDCISNLYPENYAQHQEYSSGSDKGSQRPHLPKIILNSLTPDSRILDVGCGNGDFLPSYSSIAAAGSTAWKFPKMPCFLRKSSTALMFSMVISSRPLMRKNLLT